MDTHHHQFHVEPQGLGHFVPRAQLWYAWTEGILGELPLHTCRNLPLFSWGGYVARPNPPVMKEPMVKLTLECKEGKGIPTWEGPSGSESVSTHGSTLILVSSFTTQMPKEPST